MTPPLVVFSQIQFDMAAAIKAANGHLHIDDALIIAATPCVLIDFNIVPNRDLKYIARAMRHFFKRNPRYKRFTKEAVGDGLRQDWLPDLEFEDKCAMLSDFKMILDVDADGYVIYNEMIVANLTKKEHPDHETYGKDNYTRTNLNGATKRLRDSASAEIFHTEIDSDGYSSVPLNISADEWYDIIQDASPLIKEYLGVYIQIPDLIASLKDVEEMFGMNSDSLNARNTALGRRAQKMLDIEVYDPDDLTQRRYWSTPISKGRLEEGFFKWIMRPELIEAAARLAKEENWDLPKMIAGKG